MRFLFLSLLIGVHGLVQSQNPDSAKRFIATLAGSDYYGRGYVKNGDLKAAQYIATYFKKIGLQALPNAGNYFQHFTLDVNTIEKNPTVKIPKNLRPGYDFIVHPESGNFNGKLKTKLIDASNYKLPQDEKLWATHAIILDPKNIKDPGKDAAWTEMIKKCRALSPFTILLNYKKLTWSVGRSAREKAGIEMLCDSSFQAKRVKKIEAHIESKWVENYKSQNVVGMLKGQIADTFVVVCAHYDHLGMMGDALFAGANDNASGTAMMMDLAAEFSKAKTPKYSMMFIAFGAEEAGLVGSHYFVENPLVPLRNIRFVFNIDLMGGGSNGATVVNATLHEKEFERLQKVNEDLQLLKQIKKRGKAANSDHYYFSEAGVPAFFMYAEGGVTAYHDVHDIPESLPMENYSKLFTLIKTFLEGF